MTAASCSRSVEAEGLKYCLAALRVGGGVRPVSGLCLRMCGDSTFCINEEKKIGNSKKKHLL